MKRFSIYLCVFLMLLLCGCSSKQRHNYIVAEEIQDETIYLTMFGNKTDAVNTQAIEQILHNYMEEHPNINISYESAKGDTYFQLLEKRLRTGHGDDIIIVNHDTTLAFSKQGYLSNLSDIADKINFHPLVDTQLYATDGNVYFLPTTISSFGLYCNKDLLDRYHIEVPKNRKEFLQALETFKKAGITPLCVNNDISLKTVALGMSMYPIYQQENAMAMLKELNADPQELSKQLEPGFAFVQELINKGYVDANLALQTEKTKDDLVQFATGDYPFMITGVWADSRLALMNPDFTYEIHAFPVLEDGSLLVVNADTRLAVNANSPHVKEAKEFLAYFMKKDVLQKFVDVQDSHSPLKDDEQMQYQNKKMDALQSYIDQGKIVIGSDENLDFPIWNIGKTGVTMLLEGNTLKQTMDAMQNAHSNFIGKGYENEKDEKL